ncbi:hypothetical protein TRVL_00589 [Trypanosoma vivax]|nr:hypothetical protein TRVL_00589 [Trypanosoma vivax]
MVASYMARFDTLVAGKPPTASLVESLEDSLRQMGEMQKSLQEPAAELAEIKRKAGEYLDVLLNAVSDTVSTLRVWSTSRVSCQNATVGYKGMPEVGLGDGMELKVYELAASVRCESELVARTLFQMHNIVHPEKSARPLPLSDEEEDCGRNPLKVAGSVPCERLVSAVQRLHERYRETAAVSDTIISKLERLVPGATTVGETAEMDLNLGSNDDPSGYVALSPLSSASSASSAEGIGMGSLKQANSLLDAVRARVVRQEREINELQSAIQHGLTMLKVFLGDADVEDDDLRSENGVVDSNALVRRLLGTCAEVENFIVAVRTALEANSPQVGIARPFEVVLQLSNELEVAQVMRRECAGLMSELRTIVDCNNADGKGNAKFPPATSVEQVLRLKETVQSPTTSFPSGVEETDASPEPLACPIGLARSSELMSELRHDVHRIADELLALRGVCCHHLEVLESPLASSAYSLPQRSYREHLVPLLAKQTEELRLALPNLLPLLEDKDKVGGGIGAVLSAIVERMTSLRSKNEMLERDAGIKMQICTHLTNGCVNDGAMVDQHNVNPFGRTVCLDKRKMDQEGRERLQLYSLAALLLKWTRQRHACSYFTTWLKISAVRREECQQVLSAEAVRMQKEQDQLVRMLYIVLQAMPGKQKPGRQELVAEPVLAQYAQSGDGAALSELVKERVDMSREWRQKAGSLLLMVLSLKKEVVALRQYVAEVWDKSMSPSFHSIVTSAYSKVEKANTLSTQREEASQTCTFGFEAILGDYSELKSQVIKLQQQVSQMCRLVEAKDKRILQLEKESHDIQMRSLTLSCEGDDNNVNSATRFAVSVSVEEGAERRMVLGAKRLAVETITAMAGERMAACIGEVAELTMELYSRTSTVLEEVCDAWHTSRINFNSVAVARLQDLQDLREARHGILERLPDLLRLPYV